MKKQLLIALISCLLLTVFVSSCSQREHNVGVGQEVFLIPKSMSEKENRSVFGSMSAK